MYSIKEIFTNLADLGPITIKGWVWTHRKSKNVSFIELNDGSTPKGLQLVIEPDLESYLDISDDITTGSSIEVQGDLVKSLGKGQDFEVVVKEIKLIGKADPDSYILQKKGHSLEFLREHMHLRARSRSLAAVFRVRSELSFAVHRFYKERGFFHIHTPIITAADCEGAGEMFSVTSKDLEKLDSKINFEEDFFGEHTSLTVSGQLEAETLATSLGKVYTFGPTFRAENSNTSRHLSEFWMIEPEVAFSVLEDNQKLAVEFIQYLVKYAFENCSLDLEYLHKRDWVKKSLVKDLELVVNNDFKVFDYTEVIEILEKSGKKFDYPVKWGIDLQSEHERFLTENYVKGPAVVVNYPKGIKAFYMKLNDDGKTVRAMDVLVPGLGEIIGGSEREDRFDVLSQKVVENGIDPKDLWWYLELRKFGTVPHSGFGLGFERLIMYLTGMGNIRDVIPFPRYPGNAKF